VGAYSCGAFDVVVVVLVVGFIIIDIEIVIVDVGVSDGWKNVWLEKACGKAYSGVGVISCGEGGEDCGGCGEEEFGG